MVEPETRYQRVARLQRERQAEREKRWAKGRRSRRREFKRTEDTREANHIDGYDRDDLGESED